MTAAYGFGGHRTIVDIAGGHGRLLAGILSANPAVSGILFDLPHVVAGAEPLLCKHGVAERVESSKVRSSMRFPKAATFMC